MRLLKWFLLAIVIIPIAILGRAWFTNSAYMKRPPKMDVRAMLPTGLRIGSFGWGEKLKLSEYRSAGVNTVDLAKNLNLIISELGLDYLNDLHRLKGADDGYAPWSESPIDVATMLRDAPLDAALLVSFQQKCASNKEREFYCEALKRAESKAGIFYTYGEGRLLLLDAKANDLHFAFAGPHTGNR